MQLISDQELGLQSLNGSEKELSSRVQKSKVDKLRRNRESARKCRKRKTEHVQLLEAKVNEMTIQIQNLKSVIEAKNELIRILTPSGQLQHKGENLIVLERRMIENLQRSINMGSNETQIGSIIEAIQAALHTSENSALNITSRGSLTFLFLICTNSCCTRSASVPILPEQDIFNDTFIQSGVLSQDSWTSNLIRDIGLDKSQRNMLLHIRCSINEIREKLNTTLHAFFQAKNTMMQVSESIGNIVNEFERILRPKQFSALLLGVNHNKYRKEFFLENLWDYIKQIAANPGMSC